MGGKNMQSVATTIFLMCLFSVFQPARANDTSGACVWWLLFTLTALAGGSAYLFYLVYIVKQPLGKGHGLKVLEEQPIKNDVKERKLNEERKEKQLNDNKDLESVEV